LATIIAAPMGASFLCDLGARVIKVETIGGDPYRTMGGGVGATRCNQGKESIGVDLKTTDGKAIVENLIGDADILIHNFRPGVPERLGIAWKDLRTINPRLIYVSANGYGPDGPGARRPSTHPIPGAALGGAGYQAGGTPEELLDLPQLRETARRLMRANEVNPDPNTAMVICTSALLGLLAREHTGEGQQIFVDMFGANAWANFDDFLRYDGKQPRPSLGEDLKGTHPLYRLYRCETGWIFLGLRLESEWQNFCQLISANYLFARHPQPFTSRPADLDEEIQAVMETRSAEHWENLLLPRGIGCVVADRHNLGEFFYKQCIDRSKWMVKTRSDKFGDYYRHVPMVAFSRSRTRAGGSSRGGAATRELLLELGYGEDWIDSAFDNGILWQDE
ncbi:MAG: CoA transferase, partial [Pseudomonadales bacterium]|nr:CoA transferase [Pseudomonadales bacterium]